MINKCSKITCQASFLYSIAALSLPAVFNVILSTLFVPGVICLKNIQYRLQ